MQGCYYVESLTGQQHDRVQSESQEFQPWTAVSTLLGVVSVTSYMKYSAGRLISTYSLNADGDDLSWSSDPNFCQLANVTRKTRDKGQCDIGQLAKSWI